MNRSITVLSLLVIATLGLFPTQAQSDAPIYVLREDSLIGVNISGQADLMTALQPETLSMSAAVNDENRFVIMAQLIESDQTVYYLQHEGRVSAREPFPTRTYIAVIDARTGQRRIVYERANILRFNLSPDGRYIAISYFSGDYYNSRIHLCVYDLQTQNECWTLPFWIVDQPARWINEHEFVLIQGGHMRLVNAANQIDRQILRPEPDRFSIQDVTPIPDTRNVILLVGKFDLTQTLLHGLVIMNIDSGEVLQYFDTEGFSLGSVSPEGQYLFYGTTQPRIIDLDTGLVVSQFESAANVYWRDANTLVVQGRINADSPLQIATIDVVTGVVTVLATGDAAGGIMLAS